MKFAGMFQDVMQSLVRKPATETTPRPAPIRLRGRLRWAADGCTGCALCVKDCPADAIELIRMGDKSKRFVMRYHVDRCTFCGQCVENCRFDCIHMSDEAWSLAASTRQNYTVYYGDDADVRRALGESSEDSIPEPEATG